MSRSPHATWSCSTSLGVKAQILSSAHQALPDLPSPPFLPLLLLPLAHSAPHTQVSLLFLQHGPAPGPLHSYAHGLGHRLSPAVVCAPHWTLTPTSALGSRAASSHAPHPPSHCACHMHSTLYCPLTCMTEATQGQVWTPASLVPAAQDKDLHRMYHQSRASAHCRSLTSFLVGPPWVPTWGAHPVSQPLQPGCFLPPHLTLSCH